MLGIGAINAIQQSKAERDRFESANAMANKQAHINQSAVNTRVGQERMATAGRLDAVSLATNALRSKVATSAAAGGVSGLSVSELSGDIARQGAVSTQALLSSLGFTEAQARQQNLAFAASAEAQALRYMPQTSLFGDLLGIGAQGLGMYAGAAADNPDRMFGSFFAPFGTGGGDDTDTVDDFYGPPPHPK